MRVAILTISDSAAQGDRPDAPVAIADLVIPGVSEEMRRKGMEKTPTAVLSRAVTAVRAHTIIVNLPGSPKGAVESLESIAISCLTPYTSSMARATISSSMPNDQRNIQHHRQ